MMDSSKRRSQLWNYFIILDDDGKAVCKYCEEIFSYKSSISNLKRHLQRKHPFDIPEQMRSDEFDPPAEEICSVDIVSLPDSSSKKARNEVADKKFEKEVPEESTGKRKSATWKHFSAVGEDKAACNYCQKVFSYRSSISNLKKHFERKHLFKTSNYVKNEVKKKSVTTLSRDIHDDDDDSSVDKFDIKEEKADRRRSDVWKSFKLIDANRAICLFCKETFSCRNSITNLKIHLKRKHSEQEMDRTENNNDAASTNGKLNVVSEEFLMVHNDSELFGPGSSDNVCKDDSPSKNYSVTWNLFIDQEDGRKVCCLCSEVFPAGAASETLKQHLQDSHPEYDNDIFVSEDDGDQDGPEEIIVLSAEEFGKDKKSPKDKKSSALWQYFSPRDDDMAACNLCDHILSHRSSTSNLKKHLSRKHPMINFETVEGRLRSSTCTDPLQSRSGEETNQQEKIKGSRKFSKVWETFTMYDDKRAKCNLCNHILSYKTTVSNLKKHYLRKHGSPGKFKRYTALELRRKQATLLPKRKVSSVWKYFTRQPGNQALCLLCKRMFVYKFNTSNLKKHLLRKHSRSELNSIGKRKASPVMESNSDMDDDDYSAKSPLSRDVMSPPQHNDTGEDVDDDSTRDNMGPASPSSDTDYVPLPEELIKFERHDEKSDSDSDAPKEEKVQTRRRVSKLWKYFTPQGNSRALCHICKHLLMYKSSTTNLKRHLMRKHARKKFRPTMKLKRSPAKLHSSTEPESSLFELVSSPPRDDDSDRKEAHSSMFKSQRREQEKGKRKSSSVWKYFTEQGDSKALCHICKHVLKFRSTTTNLKKHLMRKHPRRKDSDEGRSRSPLSENVLSPPPIDQVFNDTSRSSKQNSKHTSSNSSSRSRGEILSFFSAQVSCNLCGKVLVFKSVNALESHLKEAHQDAMIKKGMKTAKSECVGRDEGKDTVKWGKKRSPLWKYFTPKDEAYAVCKTCEQILSYRSSTNNLTRHLERKHPDVMKQFTGEYNTNMEELDTNYSAKDDVEVKASTSDNIAEEAMPVENEVAEQIVVATEYGDIIVKRLDEESQ